MTDTRRSLSRESTKRLVLALCSTVVITFLLEMLSHLLVRGLPPLSALAAALIDSTLLSIQALPVLYFLVIVPLARHAAKREQAERALAESEAHLRQTEEKYRGIFEHALDGIYQTKPDGTFITANTAMARILGHESAEELMAQLTDRSGWGYADPVGRAEFARLLGREGVVQGLEYEVLRRDGSRRWVSDNARAVRNAEGAIQYYEGILTDITERKRAQEALAESEGRYRALFENMLDGFAYCQMLFEGNRPQDFVYLAVNTAFETLTGLQNVVGRRVTEVIPGIRETDPELFEIYGRVARAGQTERFEHWLKPLDAWFDISVYGAQAGYFVAIFDNITERKRAEQTLRASESNYRTLIESAADGIFVLDAQGRIDDANAMACRMFGYTRKEVLAMTIGHLLTAEEVARVAPALARISAGEVMRNEWQLRRRDGTLFPGEVSATMLPGGRTLSIVRDVTERRRRDESERLQSAALQAAADAIVVTDRAGVIVWVNPAFTEISGYTAEEAIGKNPRDLVKSGKHAPAFFEDFWHTILAGRTWHGEMINRRKDGSLYTEDQAVTPILDTSGAITHFVAIKKDITERLQLEAQFRQAQKMESVGHLASGIAHDFNNLLTVINGMSDLILEQVGQDDPVHADVEEIHRAGERAAALTRQLLAFSRQQILAPQVMNFNTVVAGMESLLRRLLGEDIDLVVVPAPGLGSVKADPGQIEQVIANLAVNARDAMPQGGQLTIETQNVTIDEHYARQHGVAVTPGSYVVLVVSDCGIGMDDATRARIFEPFFTTKGPGKGTGLGLATVYGIVKQSHGFIWVYSEVGQGTGFKIYLPQVTEAAGAAQPGPTVDSGAGTETILLVEDNAGLRKLATRFLEPAGYIVLGAATGEEALSLLERHKAPVHLLLSDVVMPGMSGRQLAEQLAQTRPGVKVLYMSGYTSDTVVRHGVLDAQVSFLGKPFTAATLLGKVREVLDS